MPSSSKLRNVWPWLAVSAVAIVLGLFAMGYLETPLDRLPPVIWLFAGLFAALTAIGCWNLAAGLAKDSQPQLVRKLRPYAVVAGLFCGLVSIAMATESLLSVAVAGGRTLLAACTGVFWLGFVIAVLVSTRIRRQVTL